MKNLHKIMLGSAMACFMAMPAAHAQQQQQQQLQQQQAAAAQPLQSEQVESYFQQVEQDLQNVMAARDPQQINRWIETNFTDDATITASMEVMREDDRKVFAVANLERGDLTGEGAGLAALVGQMLDDYEIDIEVTSVEPLGRDAATVRTRISESGRIGANATGRQLLGIGRQQQQQQQAIDFERTSNCTHVIRRSDDAARLQIGMTTCEAQAQF